MKKIMFNDKYGLTQAVLASWKTQTRRIPFEGNLGLISLLPGQLIATAKYNIGEEIAIAQKYSDLTSIIPFALKQELVRLPGWKNKMFVKADLMPHRIRITNIRVERLQNISEEDCIAEGIWRAHDVGFEGTTYWYHGLVNSSFRTAKEAYASLIDKISGRGTWESNPWVFVYDFELVK